MVAARVIADETYLRQSILDPDAKVVAGFRSIMPTFKGQIDEQELIALIEFIKSMGNGQTPPRVDDAEPPTANRADKADGNSSGERHRLRMKSDQQNPPAANADQENADEGNTDRNGAGQEKITTK